MSGVSQVGGLLAIFKISMILVYFHQKGFEKEIIGRLNKENSKKELDQMKDRMSFENYEKMIAKIEEHEKRNQELELQIKD